MYNLAWTFKLPECAMQQNVVSLQHTCRGTGQRKTVSLRHQGPDAMCAVCAGYGGH